MFLKDVYSILKDIYDIDSLLCNDRDAIISRIAFVQNHESQMREPIHDDVYGPGWFYLNIMIMINYFVIK